MAGLGKTFTDVGVSSSGTTGGSFRPMAGGPDLAPVIRQLGGQGQYGIQPGAMNQMSPQQRMMQVMQQYSGG